MAGNTSSVVFALRADVDRLRTDLNRAKSQINSYRNTVSSIGKEIQGYMTGMFSIYAVASLTQNTIGLIREIDALDRALKIVTETSEGFNEAQLFLNKVAEANGQSINSLTDLYTKFIASSKASGLSTETLNGIFERITKSAAVLGLSMDDTEGALRAINQMFSKATVQSEEIRGQLGERLPGAFSVLAKSMGVTEQELGNLLKQGKVMAADVLPNFAIAYEKAIGADAEKKVRTLNSEFGRLTTAWQNFIRNIDSGEGAISRGLKSSLGVVTNTLNGEIKDAFLDFASIAKNDALGGFFYSIIDAVNKTGDAFTSNLSGRISKSMQKWKKTTEDAGIGGGGGKPAPVVVTLEMLNEQLKQLQEKRLNVPASEIAKLDKEIEKLQNRIKFFGAKTKYDNVGFIDLLPSKKDLQESINALTDSDFTNGLDEILNSITIPQEILDEQQESFDAALDQTRAFKDELQAIADLFKGVMVQMGTDIISGFAEALATGGIKGYFDNLMGIIGEGMVNLGRSLIAIGLAEKIAVSGFNPGAKIAAGAGLVFLGSKFKAASAQLGKNIAAGRGGGYGGDRGFSGDTRGQSISVEIKGQTRGRDLAYTLEQNGSKDLRAKANF